MKRISFLSLLFIAISISCVHSQNASNNDVDSVFKEVDEYLENSQVNKAISLIESTEERILNEYGEESREYRSLECKLANTYVKFGEYYKAADCLLKSSESSRKAYEKTNESNLLLLQALCYCLAVDQYIELEEYEKAIHYQKKGVDILAREFYGSEYYWNNYEKLGLCFYYIGEHKMAYKIFTDCKDFYLSAEKTYDPYKVADIYGKLVICSQNFAEAISHAMMSLLIKKDGLNLEPEELCSDYVNLGLLYYKSSILSQAYYYYTRAEECYNEIKNPTRDQLLAMGMLYNNIGNYFRRLGKYKEAIDYYNKSKDIKEQIVGVNHSSYANTLTSIGLCYQDLGDYNYAEECLGMALSIHEKIYGKDSPVLVSYQLNFLEYRKINIQEKIEQYTLISNVVKKHYGEKHEYYSLCMQGLSECYRVIGEYAEAYKYALESAEIVQSIKGKFSVSYAENLAHIAIIYNTEERYGEAEDYYKMAINIIRDVCGEYNQKYYDYNRRLFNMYYEQGNVNYCKKTILQIADLARYFMLDAMTFLSLEERAIYWDKYQNIFLSNLPYYSYCDPKNKKILESTYNGLLLGKGFLLNSEVELRKIINDSNDPQLSELYDKLAISKFQLNRLYEQPKEDRTISVQELEEEVRILSRELQQRCQEFKDQTQAAAITMKDVQLMLEDSDIAIEFMMVELDEDDIRYCALTLKSGYKTPNIVELFKKEELDALKAKYEADGAIYSNSQLYELVWEPLKKELRGIKNVYFSPVGDLHKIAIEYAKDGEKYIFEERNLYRLSSTRQLAVQKSQNQYQKSAIFGGFEFNASEDLLDIDTNTCVTKDIAMNNSINVDSLNIRGAVGNKKGVKDLPGTLIEAQKISETLELTNIKTSLITGINGTETRFKKLTGQHNDIIHIATHGFYWEGEFRNAAKSDSSVIPYTEDKALNYSGLLFSGVNNMFRNGLPKLDGVDDGILTATEISRMDLRGTELLVLSACQTGLGEVCGEGVFGLQRGFKKAGVKTILMSLWEVDDIATQLLMAYFYDNLSSGMLKNEAFIDAQNRLRNCKEYDFSSPYYWAAFILLDGIN